MSGNEAMRRRIKRSVRENRRVLNQLEPHLGCVVCRGPLTDGVCPSCDPLAAGSDTESGERP